MVDDRRGITQDGKRSRISYDQRRTMILDTALDLFSRRGFNGARTKEIAQAAGISETLIFQHFKTKRDLFLAVMNHLFDHHPLYPDVRKAVISRDDIGVFSSVAHHIIIHMRRDPRVIRFLYYATLEGEIGNAVIEKEEQIPGPFLILRDYIQIRINEGHFAPLNPSITAYLYIQALCTYLIDSEIPHEPVCRFSDSNVIETIVSLFVAGLTMGSKKGMNIE